MKAHFSILLCFVSVGLFQSSVSFAASEKYEYANRHYAVTHQVFEKYQEIQFTGEVMPTDSKEGLSKVAKRLVPGLDILLLVDQSLGGYEHSFKKFGNAIEAACQSQGRRTCQITTYVQSGCASACVELFMYGQQRAASADSSFGFHRRFILVSSLTTISPENMAQKYISRGADEQWLMTHLNIFTDDQAAGTWVQSSDLLESKIVTTVSRDFLNKYIRAH